MGYTVTHAGQDITAYVDEFTIDVQDAYGQGPGVGGGSSGRTTQASFVCYLGPAPKAIGAGQPIPPGPPSLVKQGETIITDASGDRVFAGYATLFDDKSSFTTIKTKLTCADYWGDLARITVNEVYANATDIYIIRDLCGKYAPWIDLSLLPTASNYTFAKLFLRAKSLQYCLQHLTDITGFFIWVDAYQKLHYISAGQEQSAPFFLDETPEFQTSFPFLLTKYQDDENAIINKVTFYGGKKPTNDYTQDMSYQANGTNATFIFAYFPKESSKGTIQVIKNGVQMHVGIALHAGSGNQLKKDGGTADCLVNADAETLQWDPSEIPAAGDTVTAIYRYETPLTLTLTAPTSYQYYGRYYEGTISDTTVFDIGTAVQRCRILLGEQAYGLTKLSLQCWKSGLKPGMVVKLVHPTRGINASYIIQKVQTKPLGNGEFQYNVDLGAWNWNLVDVLMQAYQHNTYLDQSTNEENTIIQAYQYTDSAVVTDNITVARSHASGQYYCGQADIYCGYFTVTD